jgi:hypothetical protein
MSTTLNSVVDRLRAFGDAKLAELDSLAAEARTWLPAAAQELAQQIAALGPALKKRKVDDGGEAKAITTGPQEEQVGGCVLELSLPAAISGTNATMQACALLRM